MMNTPLGKVAGLHGRLALEPRLLGRPAYDALYRAFSWQAEVSLTDCKLQLGPGSLTARGRLEFFTSGSYPVRLFLFDRVNGDGASERHALLLIELGKENHASQWLARLCGSNQEGLARLTSFQFNDPFVLYSTLDDQDPDAFPPLAEQPAPVRDFLAKVRGSTPVGFVFTARAGLQSPDVKELSESVTAALGVLKLTEFEGIGQVRSTSGSTRLHLSKVVQPAPMQGIPLHPCLQRVGVAFPVGPGADPILDLECFGSLRLGETTTRVRFSLDTRSWRLSIEFLELPGIPDLWTAFPLEVSLASALPGDALEQLGALRAERLCLSVDCLDQQLTFLELVLAGEKPWTVLPGVSLRPLLRLRVTYPLKKFRDIQVEAVARWSVGDSELDVVLFLESAPGRQDVSLLGSLGLETGIDLVALAGECFHRQVSGLPDLSIADLEVTAERVVQGDSHREELAFEIEVASGWHLDGFEMAIEDLSLSLALSRAGRAGAWGLSYADAQGSLQFGHLAFELTASYEPSARAWTFSGATAPGSKDTLGALLESLSKALHLPAGDFLSPFSGVQLTDCQFEYTAGGGSSATWRLSLDTSPATFHDFSLGPMSVSLEHTGGATSYSFSAAFDPSQIVGLSTLADYFHSALGLKVELPVGLVREGTRLRALQAAHDSSTDNYRFVVDMDWSDRADLQLAIDIYTQVLAGQRSKTYEVGGNLELHLDGQESLRFQLQSVQSGGASELVACLHQEPGVSLKLGQLLGALGISAELGDFEVTLRDALLARSGKPAQSLLVADLGAAVNLSGLSGLPIVGAGLKSVASLDLALQVVYATNHLGPSEVQTFNRALSGPGPRFPEPPEGISGGTPRLSGCLRLGDGQAIPLEMPLHCDGSGALQSSDGSEILAPHPSSTSTQSDNPKTWIAIGKAFGPIFLNRVGLSMEKADMSVAVDLDGSLRVGLLSLDLMGLGVKFPIQGASRFQPSFQLEGLGLHYQNGPVSLSGALCRFESDGLTHFDGLVAVHAQQLQLSAVASFGTMRDGQETLFVYAVLNQALGGPAFFFVTGLALGFGYHRKLIPPALSQVQDFPLVSQAMSPSNPPPLELSQVRDTIAEQIRLLQKDVVPAAGEYFLAVGIKFTSFKLVQGFLLAVVQFGQTFRVDVIGLASARLPSPDEPEALAEVQLAVLAHYTPDDGSLWVQGQLTPKSYILSRDCHLSGGFALACWLSGPQQGQFVLSIGGYHPAYAVPARYPVPAPVGFNWQVNQSLTVKGNGYFALVPHALMAGGALQAVWQSDSVRAWFFLGADFLIAWKPFHYSADVHVELGCEATIHVFGTHHISMGASADLNVWGPPFGGHAQVTLHVLGIHFHFGIDFGASPLSPPPLKWPQFQDSFLPPPVEWLGLNLQTGLLRTVNAKLPDGSTSEVWLVKRDELRLITDSKLPVLAVKFHLDGVEAAGPAFSAPPIGVAPMDQAQVHSSLQTISIRMLRKADAKASEQGQPPPAERLKLEAMAKKVPSGLWGSSRKPSLNPAPGTDVLDSISGFAILPGQAVKEDPQAFEAPRASLSYETSTLEGFEWVSPGLHFQGQASPWSEVEKALHDATEVRAEILASLGFERFRESFNQKPGEHMAWQPQLGSWIT